MCHCGKGLHPDHFNDEDESLEDIHEQHATRCCACVDSYLFGAPDCEECDKAGEESGEQAVWEDDPA